MSFCPLAMSFLARLLGSQKVGQLTRPVGRLQDFTVICHFLPFKTQMFFEKKKGHHFSILFWVSKLHDLGSFFFNQTCLPPKGCRCFASRQEVGLQGLPKRSNQGAAPLSIHRVSQAAPLFFDLLPSLPGAGTGCGRDAVHRQPSLPHQCRASTKGPFSLDTQATKHGSMACNESTARCFQNKKHRCLKVGST